MLNKVSTAQTSSYNGELRKKDDDREAQVLFDYDEVCGHLMSKAKEHDLDLPPLLQKSYMDHGCVTGLHRGTDDTLEYLDTFLKYLVSSDMWSILIPFRLRGKGYKIDMNDPRLPTDIKEAIINCTQSFVTTVDGKSVRRRFLDASLLSDEEAELVDTNVASAFINYKTWLARRVQLMEREVDSLYTQLKNFGPSCSER